jgi:hypothetical protein
VNDQKKKAWEASLFSLWRGLATKPFTEPVLTKEMIPAMKHCQITRITNQEWLTNTRDKNYTFKERCPFKGNTDEIKKLHNKAIQSKKQLK